MDSDKYLEGKSMQRPLLFESDSFIYRKNRFETYVKSKDLDLWHVITNGDFHPIQQNPKTKLDESKKKLKGNLLRLKAKKESSDEECSTSESEDEEYVMAVRDFKKFFKRRDRFVRQPQNDQKTFQGSRDEKNGKSDRKCFRCGDPNHLIGECTKPPKDKNQRAFFGEEDVEKVNNKTCLVAQASSESLAYKKLVRNLPKLKFDQHFCDACKIRKQAHTSHKAKNIVSTTRCLKLLHMDLFSPSVVRSYGGNRYTLVIVDDYSRYTLTRFLKDKTEAFDQFEIFSKKIQNQLGCTIVSIRTDHGREFDYEVQFGEFCNGNGITHNFSAPRPPQSNGVVERKNRTLREMSKTMLNEQSLPQNFDVTPKVEESPNVTIDETPTPSKTSPLVDYDLDKDDAIKVTKKKNLENDIEDETLEIDKKVNIKESRNHPLENIIRNLNQRTLRSQDQNQKMLKKFGLEESKPMKTPMSSDTKLTKDKECESVDSTKYRGMIGTTHLGLWYPKEIGIEKVVYADSDHAGDYVDRKSTSSICTFMGCC
nr:retrovirus-related Pol polyprotein from transposon TNT 1-94 [Tanacetum cinerariifolium]